MEERKIPLRFIAAYSLPAVPLALMGITFYVYAPKFYADVIGVPLSFLGILIILSRVFDAVIDPMIGSLSDRTFSRLGRRMPWIIASVIPICIVFYLLLSPPAFLSPGLTMLWVGVTSILFFFFWTTYTVPYEALGAELTFDYDKRTQLLGVREAGVVVGTLLAAAFPLVLTGVLVETTDRFQFLVLGLVYSVVLIFATMVFFMFVREPEYTRKQANTRGYLEGYKEVLKNRPFRILLLAYTIGGFGAALPATLIFFFVEYVLLSDKAPLFLTLYFGLGFAFVPVWIYLSKVFDKRKAWMLAVTVNTGSFIGVLFLGPGDEFLYGLIVSISAIGYGGTLAIPPSMQADVIDLDELTTGLRREGQYIGLWSVAKKLAAALGAGIAFPILDFVGYQANTAQSPEVMLTLKLLYAGIPCVCNIAAVLVMFRYPIHRSMHKKIRKAIRTRASLPKSSTSANDLISSMEAGA